MLKCKILNKEIYLRIIKEIRTHNLTNTPVSEIEPELEFG